MSNSEKEIGKHYVVGDLHGQYGAYMDVVNLIGENDTLYVLGNVISRNRYDIKILQDMMNRNNVKLILGNHECEFIEFVNVVEKYNLNNEEINAYYRWFKYIRDFKNGKGGSISRSTYERGIASIKEELCVLGYGDKNLTPRDIKAIGMWIHNGTHKTLADYASLGAREMNRMYKFLCNSAIAIYKKIGDKKVCMVHAAPFDDERFLKRVQKYNDEKIIKYSSIRKLDQTIYDYFVSKCTMQEPKDLIEGEPTPFEKMHDLGYETIFGHAKQGVATRKKDDNSLCLDVSSGAALYCIENGLVRYIGQAYEEPSGLVSDYELPVVIDEKNGEISDGFEVRNLYGSHNGNSSQSDSEDR